jgi:hypothetical protein
MRPIRTVVLAALLGGLAGCSGDGAAVKPDFTMASADLGGEHDRHPRETDNKYKGKTMELSGRVIRVETVGESKNKLPEERGLFVTLSHQIQCRFPDSEKSAVSKLQQGDTVSIVGVYHVVESKNYMYLDNCRLRPPAK